MCSLFLAFLFWLPCLEFCCCMYMKRLCSLLHTPSACSKLNCPMQSQAWSRKRSVKPLAWWSSHACFSWWWALCMLSSLPWQQRKCPEPVHLVRKLEVILLSKLPLDSCILKLGPTLHRKGFWSACFKLHPYHSRNKHTELLAKPTAQGLCCEVPAPSKFNIKSAWRYVYALVVIFIVLITIIVFSIAAIRLLYRLRCRRSRFCGDRGSSRLWWVLTVGFQVGAHEWEAGIPGLGLNISKLRPTIFLLKNQSILCDCMVLGCSDHAQVCKSKRPDMVHLTLPKYFLVFNSDWMVQDSTLMLLQIILTVAAYKTRV